MLPPALAALDEYGLPLQLVARLEPVLPAGSDLDTVLAALRRLDARGLRISRFEADLLEEIQATL
jgi:hypothetical protein